ncbi:importin subunit beta-1-like [Ananas comosus]|uniref:Importin subunit beta-1-like n=1 Tax=Ananas comosus TaxID=4615 RepID=A0A6P5F2L9_ANACO|nr:importin subunit beta-1-like [Ananas comosus]
MAMEITQILLAAQSPDAQIRTAAEESLKQFQEQNLPHFLLALSVELSNEQKPPASRRLAGIILKNSLDAKDSIRKEELTQRWVSVDPAIKFQIKESLLRTLGSPVAEARHTSSQVTAKVASIEIPRREWQELIAKLLTYMTQQDAASSLKQATLEALGYVCEEISPQDLQQDQVNAVLTAVVQGMNQKEHSSEVRLAAVKALYNALDFAQTNFENELERAFIIKVVCETAVSKESEIRQAAFECLVSIASTYYEILEPFMPSLFNLTSNAVRGDEEPVALQAIEFWSTVCDEEIAIQEEYGGADEGSSSLHHRFIEKALPSLVPMLLESLLKQEEDQDQDDSMWNLSMAGGTCLGLVARTVGDAVVPLVMPFVQENIMKADWHNREAATFAFGSILEGPSVEKLAPLVHSGLDFLLNAMKDQNSHVKDTTAWTLGRIFELLHAPTSAYPVITNENLPRIMAVLLESIRDVPNVAEKVCGAIYFLAQGYEDEPSSSVLTPYLGDTISALLSTADRTDTTNSRLRASAYETLNEMVRCSNLPETSNMIAQLLHEIMKRLNQTLELQIISSEDREKQSDLQALLCGVLQVIIQKLSNSDSKALILQSADQMMLLFLRVFACRSSSVHEEAMLAIGALAYATGSDFAKYMPEFYRYLEMGLQNFEEYQVCSISVGVVGDICRALDEKVLPFCDGIMSALLKDLSNAMLHRSVKPPIFSCFGDIALAIGENFEKYVPYAIPMLQGAAELCSHLDASDEDMLDYGNQLRRGIFEAYSGILQGFKNTKAELLMPYAGNLLKFTEAVFRDKNRDEGVTRAAVAVMGDLADALGPTTKALFKESHFYSDFLEESFQSDDDQLRETATWAQGMIRRVFLS